MFALFAAVHRCSKSRPQAVGDQRLGCEVGKLEAEVSENVDLGVRILGPRLAVLVRPECAIRDRETPDCMEGLVAAKGPDVESINVGDVVLFLRRSGCKCLSD